MDSGEQTIDQRKFLVDALYEELAQLEKAYAREGSGRHLGMFLQQEIARHADAETLQRIRADVREEIRSIEQQTSSTLS